jgi:MbtH protein
MADADHYVVVMNEEEQYSIWPAEQEVPSGWEATGITGTKEQCLGHIDRTWVDMRPASLRRVMDES